MPQGCRAQEASSTRRARAKVLEWGGGCVRLFFFIGAGAGPAGAAVPGFFLSEQLGDG